MNILKDKVALITGCNRGIGKEILYRFAEEGAVVYAVSRTEGSLDNSVKELKNRGGVESNTLIF